MKKLYKSKISDGNVIIPGTYSNLYGNIEIPSQINGMLVVNIDAQAFQNQTNLTRGHSPFFSKLYRKFCFANTGLTDLIIPTTVIYIGSNVFNGMQFFDNLCKTNELVPRMGVRLKQLE